MKEIPVERKELINRLGYIRNRANLSARELSLRLGKSFAYFAKFENGDFNIPTEVLLDAITICGSTPEEFFWKDINKYEKQKELINNFEKLSDESKDNIMNIMKNMK